MKLAFENGILRVENNEGLRWQLTNAAKPALPFEFDALSVNGTRTLRRVGPRLLSLTETETEQVKAFVAQLAPPPWATFQKQTLADLRAFAHGLINSVIKQLEYDSIVDVMVTSRTDSTDLRAGEARRVLAYVDAIWNAFYGLEAQIENTPKDALRGVHAYANMLPSPPGVDFFAGNRQAGTGRSTSADGDYQQPEAQKATVNATSPAKRVRLEHGDPEETNLSEIVNRVFIFDDVYSDAQLAVLKQWALQTPHWMLTNSAYDEQGTARHRIWGASYIEAWNKHGWCALPPVLFSSLMTLFKRLGVSFTAPEYIGLNGQSRGQNASTHVDCPRDARGHISILVYMGEDTDGDLLLFDKDFQNRVIQRVSFRPNRVVAFDGSIPHAACAPSDDKFRMSLIVRGAYEHK